jgi:N-methylhydantoinase B
VESSISDVEMFELQSPFLYLWRREGTDNAGAGRWRGGTSVTYAMTPHNSPFVMLGWAVMGALIDPTQSMSGAYPPALAYRGTIARGLNLTEAWQKGQIPQNVAELEALAKQSGGSIQVVNAPIPVQPMTTDRDVGAGGFGGAKGIGDPLDREPERVLADIDNRIFSIEFASKVFGVIVDPKTMEIDLKATEKARKDIKAERKQKGVIWGGKK